MWKRIQFVCGYFLHLILVGGKTKRFSSFAIRKKEVKVSPRQAKVAQGVPGRLRPRIFLTFRHYMGGRSSAKRTGRLYPRRNLPTPYQQPSPYSQFSLKLCTDRPPRTLIESDSTIFCMYTIVSS